MRSRRTYAMLGIIIGVAQGLLEDDVAERPVSSRSSIGPRVGLTVLERQARLGEGLGVDGCRLKQPS